MFRTKHGLAGQTLGLYPMYCMQANVECLVEMYTADKEEQLLGGSPDFVLDAIDNINTKVGQIWGP